MKNISLLNPTIATSNIGDHIILESIKNELKEMFPNDFFIDLPTQERIHSTSWKIIKKSDLSFVCGTNLLSSNMNSYNQWKINLLDSLFLKKAILLGVGWWQYQKKPNFYTKFLLKRVLHSKVLHSVRDNYTQKKLESIGITNVVNTACPTMWSLTEIHCKKIPKGKGKNVVCTITDYNIDKKKDLLLFKTLVENYENVYLWLQGSQDYNFYKENLSHDDIKIIPPNLDAYNNFLKNTEDLDYVGTRLHAGIKAMQYFKRSIIIAIDNRSIEMSKDVNLVIFPRENISNLSTILNSSFETKIKLPEEKIKKWKDQFRY